MGRNSDGKVFILTLAVASELLEDINRVYLNYTYYINILEDAYGC